MEKKEEHTSKTFIGTLFYGVIVNFVILVLIDSGKGEDSFPHDPYIFILMISLLIGFTVSYLLQKFKVN